MSLSRLALIAGLVPILGIHLCWLLSWWQGHVGDCIPYLEGCTTISRTGRHGLGYHLFKLILLPSCVLLALYWHGVCQSLSGPQSSGRLPWIQLLGISSVLFLALYTSFLGSPEPAFAHYRRIGVSSFFGLMFMAELLLCIELRRHHPEGRTRILLSVLVGGQFLLGLLSIPISVLVADNDHLENIIEWHFCLLMFAFVPLSAPLWRGWHWRWNLER